jgi:hypothetical protein
VRIYDTPPKILRGGQLKKIKRKKGVELRTFDGKLQKELLARAKQRKENWFGK